MSLEYEHDSMTAVCLVILLEEISQYAGVCELNHSGEGAVHYAGEKLFQTGLQSSTYEYVVSSGSLWNFVQLSEGVEYVQ